LYANGELIPINRTEGSYDAKRITEIGEQRIIDGKEQRKYNNGDSFYRSVKRIAKTYDLDKEQELKTISEDWYNVVKKLSSDWVKTKQYLDDKKLAMD
jgi:hypothetical protein